MVKNAAVLLAELVLILTGLVLVGTVETRGFDNLKVYTTIFHGIRIWMKC